MSTLRFAGLPKPVRALRSVRTFTVDWKSMKSATTDLAKAENNTKHKVFRGSLLGLMLVMPVMSFFLGCWQVKRLQWKVDLIKKAEFQLAEPPLPDLPADLDPAAIGHFQFRRFSCRGHFDYSQEIFLGPRIRNGEVGYLVITPFVRAAGGKPILIERGWIRKAMVIPETRAHGYLSHLAFPQGEITIEAMFRIMPRKASIHIDHEPGTKLFYVHDVPAMAEQSGSLPIYAQMIYDLSDHPDWRAPDEKTPLWWRSLLKKHKGTEKLSDLPSSTSDSTLEWQEFEFWKQGVPVGVVPKVNFTNNHLQYLITWFGVSFVSTCLLLYSFYKKKTTGSAEALQKAKMQHLRGGSI
ncbi:SURF1-domain-containing protein [Metschnikowia bicuspidata]|uniref:SURF1-like protein n=1 Tax=Metschnikowia bicuspidata TaxID=27322 RepID=A0A4P9ZHC3_9ASCO|nr:SURF1-domain-containing protein [Metschnikowia bicuspidata]